MRVVGDSECLDAEGAQGDVELEVGVEAEDAAEFIMTRVCDGVRVASAIVDGKGWYWRIHYPHARRGAKCVFELQQAVSVLLAPR